MKTRTIAALSTLAMLCVTIRGFSQEAKTTATNAPAPTAGTNIVAGGAPGEDLGPAITGKVLALRDKDGNFSYVKLLADDAVYHVTPDEKAKELATTARFKMVKANGEVVEEKPVGAAAPRRVLTVTAFSVIEPTPAAPAGTDASTAGTNAPTVVTNAPPVKP